MTGLAAVALALAAPTPAVATAPAVPAASVGFDISYPQCGRALPSAPGFGVVGVNHGHSFSTNPCLEGELRWVVGEPSAARAFYVNTGAPGPGDPHWPRRQREPRECRGANSTLCAYDYGWNSTRASFASVLRALLHRHTPTPRVVATSARWWLDVEVANPWESWLAGYGPSHHSHLVDQSAVLGSLAYLRSQGVSYVGIYSSVPMWGALMGRSAKTFASVPVWIPGSASLPEAVLNCATKSFTGGFVAMTQYPSRGYDGDYRCGLKAVTVTASSTVAAASAFHDQLAVRASDGAVTFTPSAGSSSLVVSPTGAVTTSGALARGTYRVAGTTSDAGGDTGTFSLTLRVGIIAQAAPTAGAATVSASSTYSSQLATTGGAAPVAFTQAAGQPALRVSASGLVTTDATLAAGTYTASGTTSDASGDSGTFRFTLTVGQLAQLPPTTESVPASASATFALQLLVSGNVGAVTFSQTTGQPALLVSPSGVVTASGPLAAGTYHGHGDDERRDG